MQVLPNRDNPVPPVWQGCGLQAKAVVNSKPELHLSHSAPEPQTSPRWKSLKPRRFTVTEVMNLHITSLVVPSEVQASAYSASKHMPILHPVTNQVTCCTLARDARRRSANTIREGEAIVTSSALMIGSAKLQVFTFLALCTIPKLTGIWSANAIW